MTVIYCDVCGRNAFVKAASRTRCDDCHTWYELYRAVFNFTRRLNEVVRDAQKRGKYALAYGYRGVIR